MKVAVIVRRLNVTGGLQRLALECAHYLKRSGHEVTVYAFVHDPEQGFKELFQGLHIVSLDSRSYRSKFPLFSYISQLRSDARNSKLLAAKIDSDTDILNPHGEAAFKVARYYKKNTRNIPAV